MGLFVSSSPLLYLKQIVTLVFVDILYVLLTGVGMACVIKAG